MRKISCLIICLNTILCYAQPSTDVYLFDMKINSGNISLSNPVNITHREGYDNQPSFSPKVSLIYYTSAIDTLGNTEIKTYDYRTKRTNLFPIVPKVNTLLLLHRMENMYPAFLLKMLVRRMLHSFW